MSERLYARYRQVRVRLLAELRRRHPHAPIDELLGYSHNILDRALFLALAEGRGLVPPGVCDATRGARKEFEEFDFSEDVSVEVLGQVFEQSIASGTQKVLSRRRLEGIFYTPPFITHYLVRETLGHVIAEAWERAGVDRATAEADRIGAWESYRNQLRRVRVLDPACGSGAFLLAVFDALAQQLDRAERVLSALRGLPRQGSLLSLRRAILKENLFGVDKSAESVEIARLSLWLKSAERGRELPPLDGNIRHGNSVVSDPRVDPSAFDYAQWPAGFDVVIGNPPYVRQELLAACKEHWKSEFRTYHGKADLFVYFFERGLQLLKPGGRLGYIVSNKWLRGGYAEKLRALLARECTIETLVDFGHAPIFPDADAFPCILTVRKSAPSPDQQVRVTIYPREELGKEQLASYIDEHQLPLPQRALSGLAWSLEPPEVLALLEKLRRNGTPLGQYAAAAPRYGIKTGCNAAYVIDEATREGLCREDPRSAEVLQRFVRGQDLCRWSAGWGGLWLLLLKSSGDYLWPWSGLADELSAERVFAATYPAVYRRLKPFEARLRQRSDQGKFWWELRACTYYESFAKPRLLYPDILWRADFCSAAPGTYTNNTTYMLPSDDQWLLACLNAPLIWSYLFRTAQHGKDDALRMFGQYVVTIPIATPTHRARARVASEVARLTDLTQELQQTRARDVAAPGLPQKRAQILSLERSIAEEVHAAYQITAAESRLLRETQPPRTPPW